MTNSLNKKTKALDKLKTAIANSKIARKKYDPKKDPFILGVLKNLRSIKD